MYCNVARVHGRERCGPQACFWEARAYPAWAWTIGSVSAGLTVTVAYVAFLRWAMPLVARLFA